MNLIDILNQILSTKNELKEILKEIDYSDDFSRYSVSVHNFIAQLYNKGYIDGYNDTVTEELGISSYPEELPIQYLEYETGSLNYDPYSSDGLTDIMRDVLGYRLDIKEELDTNSDYFPSYPEYLKTLSNTIYDTGYNDGADKALEDITPEEPPEAPTFTFSDNVFSITTEEAGVNLYYKIGEYGMTIRYTEPVTISSSLDIYYWAQRGQVTSTVSNESCSYSSTGTVPDSPVYPPFISSEGNVIYISSEVEGTTLLYSIDSSEWRAYNGPFEINGEGTHNVSAIAIRNNVISIPYSQDFTYRDPSVIDTTPKCENVILEQSDENVITLSTPTSGATIHYRIDDGQYSVYSSSFVIYDQCIIYAFASKDDYYDSDTIYWPLTIIEVFEKPETPRGLTYNDGTVQITTTTKGAHIFYRIGNVGDYTEVENHYVRLNPTQDCVIYAYADNHNRLSDQLVYNYSWYSFTFNLDKPTIELINNRIVITSDHTVWYTLDGRDPRVYGTSYVEMNDGFSGIGISETTTIRAVNVDSDENLRNHFSSEEVKTFSPITPGEEGYVYSGDYFTVLGASEIRLNGAPANIQIISYSTDKRNWTAISSSAVVSGLDRNTRYYLQTIGTDGTKLFDSFSFGVGDEVTVSGNVLSIIRNGDFTQYNTPKYTQTLKGLFKNCTTLVNAKDLVIPYTSLLGSDCEEMFSGCTNLVNAPANLYFKELKTESCYKMFYGCSSLKLAPSFNFNILEKKSCASMFEGCTSLSTVNRFELYSCGESCMEDCFKNCTNLVSVSLEINGGIGRYAFRNSFLNCVNFDNRNYINTNTYIDNVVVNADNTAEGCFYHTFEGCSKLSSFGTLPSITAAYSCYEGMFKDCVGLKEMNGIGLMTIDDVSPLGERCCYGMFEGCTSLTTAPELKTKYLTRRNCYSKMFYNCSSLNYIKADFNTDPHGGTYTSEWVYGVASKGTFVQSTDATWEEYSVNAIPVGWTVALDPDAPGKITSFSINYDRVTITASNDNPIYYQINSTDGEWILYTGPFEVDANCYVYAKCLSNRGVWGAIYESDLLEISVPELIISSQDNIVTISKPTDFDYGIVYYRLYTYRQHNLIQDWTVYNGSFEITTSVTVSAYAVKNNGTDGPEKNQDVIYGINLPEIACIDNVVSISCSTPNYNRIIYKINDAESWSEYTEPFIISSDCRISAKASIIDPYNGSTYWSDVVSVDCIYNPEGESYVLHIPIFERRGNTNQVYVIYSQHGYYSWEDDWISVMYRVNGGTWSKYISSFGFGNDITIDTYAIDGNGKTSSTASYSFTYESSYESITVPSPTIQIIQDSSHFYWLYITNTDPRATNMFRFSSVEPSSANNHSDWSIISGGVNISSAITSATIIAVSTIDSYNSEPTSYSYTRESVPVTIIPDPPVIRFNQNTNTVSIDATLFNIIYYSLDGVNYYTYTQPFTISESKNIYSYVVYLGNSSTVNNRFCEYKAQGGGGGGDEPSRTYSVNDYLTFEVLEDGNIGWFNLGQDGVANPHYFEIKYSKNGGTWTTITPTSCGIENIINIPVLKGDKVRFKADNPTYVDAYFDTNTGDMINYRGQASFRFSTKCNVCGNIMSMISSTNFASLTSFSRDYVFESFFGTCAIIHAKELYLPATGLSRSCYDGLFGSCSGLVSSIKSLPATTTTPFCYSDMFYSCTSLISVPVISAVGEAANACCRSMFMGCSSLEIGPNLLMSTLKAQAYSYTFYNCTNLKYAKVLAISKAEGTQGAVDVEMFKNVEARNGTVVIYPNGFFYPLANSVLYDLIYNLNWTVIESTT